MMDWIFEIVVAILEFLIPDPVEEWLRKRRKRRKARRDRDNPNEPEESRNPCGESRGHSCIQTRKEERMTL